MSNNVGRIELEARINKKQFNNDLNGIKSMAIKAGAVIASAFAVKKTFDFSKASVKLGSALEQTNGLVNQVFKNMSGKVDIFSKEVASQFGLTELMAKKYTSMFGAMSQAMGFTEDDAFKMSTNLSALAGDLTSVFDGMTQDEAFTKLKSVFSGETETLKDLGIVMTQNSLDAYAMANGYNKVTKDMSEAEKVALRYEFVMNRLSYAQGNYSREATTRAGMMSKVSLDIQASMADIGSALIEIFRPVLRIIVAVTSKFREFAAYFKAFVFALTGKKNNSISEPIQSAVTETDNLSAGIKNADKGFGKANNQAKKLQKTMKAIMGIDELNILSSPKDENTNDTDEPSSSNPSPLGMGNVPKMNIPDLTKGFKIPKIDTTNVDKFAEKIKSVFFNLKNWILENKDMIISAVAGLGAGIATFLLAPALIDAFAKWGVVLKTALMNPLLEIKVLAGLAGGALKGALATIFSPATLLAVTIGLIVAAVVHLWQTSEKFRSSVIDTWGKITNLFTTIFDDVKQSFSDFWENYGKPIMKGLTEAWENFTKNVEDLWINVLKPVVDGFIEALTILWSNVLKPILDLALVLIGEVIKIVLKLWNEVFSPLISWLSETFSPLIKFVVNMFVEQWRWLSALIKPIIEFITGLIEEIGNYLSGLIDFMVGIFTLDFEKVLSGISKIAESYWNIIKKTITFVWDFILAYIKGGVSFFENTILNPIKEVFKGAFDSIGQFISDKWDWILGLFTKGGKFFSGIAEGIGSVFVKIVNGLIDGINWVILKPFEFINDILNRISSINILGARPFGFIGQNPLQVPKIPYLAEGGWVEANTPRLAVIGDNKRYGEVVAPENKLNELLDRAVNRNKENNSTTGDLTVILKLEDNTILAKEVIKGYNKLAKQH